MDEEKFISINNNDYDEPRWSIGEDGIANDEQEKSPSALLMTSAALVILYKKTIGKAFKTTKKKINAMSNDYKKGLVSGALAATLLLSGVGLTAKSIEKGKKVDQIRETRIEELISNGALTTNEKGKIVINLDDSNRYNQILPYGTNPRDELAREYYNEIINASRNSGVSANDELRRFLNSFVKRTTDLDGEDYYNYITGIITEINHDLYNPTYDEKYLEVGGKVFEYGEYDQNNSPRR